MLYSLQIISKFFPSGAVIMSAGPDMYGPPRDCKVEFGREDKSAAMYSAFDGAACSWPG